MNRNIKPLSELGFKIEINPSVKPILYIDMDGTIVDFESAFKYLSSETLLEYEGRLDEIDGIFSLMEPMDGAIEAINELSVYFDIYILSTSPWLNKSASGDKLSWIQKYLGDLMLKRLITSHNKHLNIGHFLIDDRPNNGAREFCGEWICFGHNHELTGTPSSNWPDTVNYLKSKLSSPAGKI